MSQGIKATIPHDKLQRLIEKAWHAVGKLYPYFLVDVRLAGISCSATDLQIGIVAELEKGDDVTIDMGGTVCVPARKLRDLVAALNPETVIELTGLDNNRLRIESGDYSGIIACVDPEVHFPAMDVPAGDVDFVCDGDLVQGLYAACSHAMYKEEGTTNSLYLRAENGRLLGVATDGRRLSLAAKGIDDCGAGFDKGVIVPGRTLSKIALLSPHSCEIRIRENGMSFEQVRFTLVGRMLEADYPNFRAVIPTTHPHFCIVKARELADIVERVQILAESDTVLLDISPGEDENGDIQVSAENVAGTCQDLVPAEVKGEKVCIRVAPRHLVEALRSLGKDSEDVIVKYNTDIAPLVLIPADHSTWDERIEILVAKGR